jgi:hypothetical protein
VSIHPGAIAFTLICSLPRLLAKLYVKIIKADLYPMAYKVVQKAAGLNITLIDWNKVNEAVILAKGIPIEIMLSLE